jgi:DnaK suppressor protein
MALGSSATKRTLLFRSLTRNRDNRSIVPRGTGDVTAAIAVAYSPGRPLPVGLLSSDVLTPEQTRHFRERLEAEKARLEAAVAALDAELKRPVREEEGVSDVGDEAANVFDREEAIAQIEVDRDILDRIEKALPRLDQGTYGISEVSGKPIPLERLVVLPWATTLVDAE